MSTDHTKREPSTCLERCQGEEPTGSRPSSNSTVPIYVLRLVRERTIEAPTVASPADVAPLLCTYLSEADREHFVVIMLSSSQEVIGINTAHVGTLRASVVSAREVFKPAILANAASIVVGHNHPSGNLEPSREDVHISRRLVEAGELLDIVVLDSIIIGFDGDYTSLAQRGLLRGGGSTDA